MGCGGYVTHKSIVIGTFNYAGQNEYLDSLIG
jgi:hypothetical protein